MKKDKGKTKIVIKSKKEKNTGNVKTKAIFAVFIMVASALIVSGSAWGYYGHKPKGKMKLAWQIGDVERSKRDCPWDEFGNFRAPPYTRTYRVGQCYNKFPRITAPYCQGRPSKVNIRFNTDMSKGGKFIFRYSPGYTGYEKIQVFYDGKLLKTFYDQGGHSSSNYCTYKMVKHTVKIPRDCSDDEHVITIVHKGGDGALWDWLKLKTKNPCRPSRGCDDDCDDDHRQCCKEPKKCKKPKCYQKPPSCLKKPRYFYKPRYYYKPTYYYNYNNFYNYQNFNFYNNQYINFYNNQNINNNQNIYNR